MMARSGWYSVFMFSGLIVLYCTKEEPQSSARILYKFMDGYFNFSNKSILLEIVDSTAKYKLSHEIQYPRDSTSPDDGQDPLSQLFVSDSMVAGETVEYYCRVQGYSELPGDWDDRQWIIVVQFKDSLWKIIDYGKYRVQYEHRIIK